MPVPLSVRLRSTLFFIGQLIVTPPYALLAWLIFPLPPRWRYAIISTWSRLMMVWVRIACGVKYEVQGMEHLPTTPCVVLSKHQSAWETLAFQALLPPQVWVLKRELLWVPFFGWGLATLSPIAINRQQSKQAAKQMMEQGRDRIKKGFWIIVFPEGTRVPIGQTGQYKQGGARLAMDLQAPVLPIAHNAGLFWPRQSFLKYPGTIQLRIGPVLYPQDYPNPQALTAAAQTWIEDQVQRLPKTRPSA